MVDKARGVFNKLCADAEREKDIIGLFLFGSRAAGKKFIHDESDYDLLMIVKNSSNIKYHKKYNELKEGNISGIDLTIKSQSEIKKPVEEWEKYLYSRVAVLTNKTNWLEKHIKKLSKIPGSQIRNYISGNLDGYINYVYRSLKCHRDNHRLGARLEANREVELFLKVAFALHDGNVVPYYKYLDNDLRKYPLKKFGVSSTRLIQMINQIINHADIKVQQELLGISERAFRKAGYGKVFDSWREKLDWMKNFRK